MRWDDFRQSHPRAHLIDAEVTAANDVDAGQAAGLLRSVVARLGVRGDYAIREQEGRVHLAIETDYDRDRLRAQLGAESLPSPAGWASHAGIRFRRSGKRALRPLNRLLNRQGRRGQVALEKRH